MEIKIYAKHLSLAEEQEEMIRMKMEKLTHLTDRLSDESTEIKVELDYKESHIPEEAYSCHATFFVPKDVLRAEAVGSSLDAVVDMVVGKIKSQIDHYKDKLHHVSDRR